MISTLLIIVFTLAVVGLLLWAVQQIPMDPAIAKVIRVVVIVLACLWMLGLLANAFGVDVGIGHLRD